MYVYIYIFLIYQNTPHATISRLQGIIPVSLKCCKRIAIWHCDKYHYIYISIYRQSSLSNLHSWLTTACMFVHVCLCIQPTSDYVLPSYVSPLQLIYNFSDLRMLDLSTPNTCNAHIAYWTTVRLLWWHRSSTLHWGFKGYHGLWDFIERTLQETLRMPSQGWIHGHQPSHLQPFCLVTPNVDLFFIVFPCFSVKFDSRHWACTCVYRTVQ